MLNSMQSLFVSMMLFEISKAPQWGYVSIIMLICISIIFYNVMPWEFHYLNEATSLDDLGKGAAL